MKEGTVKISGTKKIIQDVITILEKDFYLFGLSTYRENVDGGYHRFVNIIPKKEMENLGAHGGNKFDSGRSV